MIRLTLHSYNDRLVEKKTDRHVQNTILFDFVESNLKGVEDYTKALQIVHDQEPMQAYLSNYAIPIVADWPGQFFIRKAIVHRLNNNETIPSFVTAFLPIMGPLHVSLNGCELVFKENSFLFNNIYKGLFGNRKELDNIVYSKFGRTCKNIEFLYLTDLLSNLIPLVLDVYAVHHREENNNGDGENYTCNISNNVNSMSTTSAKLPLGLLSPKLKKPKIKLEEIQQTNVKIIIDLSFDEYMNDAEIISLSSQLTRCYSTNRSTINPVDLIFTSFNKRIEERFVLRLKDYLNWKNISFHSQYYLNYFNTDNNNRTNSDGGDDGGNGKLIYLTADSDNIINTLDENNIYIIGGIVDKNRHKSLCYNKAVEEGIETARLPIENFIKLSSRKVLAINHVFDILIKWLEHKDWEKAFLEVIPQRKFSEEKG
ncbi:10622_t:CDS:2 [Entrophospora sp. SA101]|nr:10622_t:CDS:2 [Entrophospora sp. SA101]